MRKDGTRFWASVVIDAINDDEGKLIGFAKITRDMTDKREAQQALLEAERRFRMLVQGVTDYAIYMLDPEGPGDELERRRAAHQGLYARRDHRRAFLPLLHARGPRRRRAQTRARDRARDRPLRSRGLARAQGRHALLGQRGASTPSTTSDGELIGFAKITRDMTEKREAQLRLEESREQLFRSQKMEALGQLTGGLAHDFNNLLTAILGACELASRNVDDPEKLKRMLDGVRGSAQRGASLTKQLLAFARAQPLEIKQIDLKEFLRRRDDAVPPSLRSNIEVVTEISDQLWPVDADAGALELALLNLAFNARDAMKDGGTLKISAHNEVLDGQARRAEGRACRAQCHRHRHGHAARGHGAGVRAVLHDQELWRRHRPWPQPGVRLRQADRRRGHGRVRARARESTFTLYLPGEPQRAGHGDARRTAISALGRVLIVEDDVLVAELAAGMLGELGFEAVVTTAPRRRSSGWREATSPSSIFSDIVMPGGISGIELARKVRDRFPELPILLTTGYSEQVGGTHGFPVLQKPYEMDTLARRSVIS